MRKQDNAEVFRITGARQGLEADIRGRQRRYVLSMLIRTVAVILAVTLWNVERPLAIAALVVGGILPYIAVVIANAGRENPPPSPPAFIPPPLHQAIGPSRTPPAEPDKETAATEGEHKPSDQG
jgi:hypothetical protein